MIGSVPDRRNMSVDHFLSFVTEKITVVPPDEYALVSLDFDNFNFINDLFSYEIGNAVLSRIVEHFDSVLEEGEFFTRNHADHFLLWIKITETPSVVQRLCELCTFHDVLGELLPNHYSLICSGGIIYVQPGSESITSLMDKANFARKKAKGNNYTTFLLYDEKMSQQVHWRKIITLMMEVALHNREFEMYLQPKFLIKTRQIIGAEALVRWKSPTYGMIYPDRFIPVFEQNGFIKELDFFMLSEACSYIREVIEAGGIPLPISVNFSRSHLQTSNLVERIFNTVNAYGIATNLIEIELTENVYVDEFQTLLDIASELRYLGFKVSLDDFGSAYSSLNYLKDLPFDIIKIDKRFLDVSSNTDKGRTIVAKMVELIKSLRMIPVMERVETLDQVDFLAKLGCDLGQGYYFAKPMPLSDFKVFVSEHPVAEIYEQYITSATTAPSYDQEIPQELQMDNWELYTLGKSIDMGIIKGRLDKDINVQYINDRALEYLGYSRREFREICHNSVSFFTHSEDLPSLSQNIEHLIQHGTPLEFQTRAFHKDGHIIVFQGRASCVTDSLGQPVGIFAFQDVTEDLARTTALQNSLQDKIAELEQKVTSERASREALRISEERYKLIMEQSEDIMFEWDFTADYITFSDKFQKIFGRSPNRMHFSNNPAVRASIHPDDLPMFEHWIQSTYQYHSPTQSEFRLANADGVFIWIQARSIPILDDQNVPIKCVGVFTNIDKQKRELAVLVAKSQFDPLTGLLNKEEIQKRVEQALSSKLPYFAFFIVDIDNFKGVNDNLGHQFGDTVLREISHKITSLFGENDCVGRLGGDEIAILMRNAPDENAIYRKAEQLLIAIRNTYYGASAKYVVSGSIGIALYPEHGTTYEALYHNADVALYESKRQGKDCFTVYHPDMALMSFSKNLRTPVEFSERFMTTYFEGDFTYNVFELLYETKDIKTSMQKILELTGRQFFVDRVYVFEHNLEAGTTTNTYEWCAPGVSSEIDMLQDLPLDSMSFYLARYSKEGILICNDIAEMDDYSYNVLAPQGIQAFLHCAFYDERAMTGFIGFDICTTARQWRGEEIATLGYLARILSVFLKKKQSALELQESYINHIEMLDNVNGLVYVTDPTSQEILYVNNAMKELGIGLGQQCFRAVLGVDAPCENCPINYLTSSPLLPVQEVYSKKLNMWLRSAATSIRWLDNRRAMLICCTDITQYKNTKKDEQ